MSTTDLAWVQTAHVTTFEAIASARESGGVWCTKCGGSERQIPDEAREQALAERFTPEERQQPIVCDDCYNKLNAPARPA